MAVLGSGTEPATGSRHPPATFSASRLQQDSAELLRQRHDDPRGATDVAEPVDLLELLNLADELGASGATHGHGGIEVVEYKRSASNPDVADPTSARQALFVEHSGEQYHNGGQLQFGPGCALYMSIGDGGEGGGGAPAQDLSSLYGKIIRIDPRPTNDAPYGILGDNPFAAMPGARAEIWLYGVRNPWRWSFDSKSGDMLVGDVGEQTREEVDWLRGPTAGSGANLGWNCVEGSVAHAGCGPPGGLVPGFDPILEHLETEGHAIEPRKGGGRWHKRIPERGSGKERKRVPQRSA